MTMTESRYKQGDPVPVSVLRFEPPIFKATFGCDARVEYHTDGSCTVYREGPGEYVIRITGEGKGIAIGAPTTWVGLNE